MKLIQRLLCHINGEFMDSHYEILAVAPNRTQMKTGITKHIRLKGESPESLGEYETIASELHFGTDTYDLLKQNRAREWIRRRLGKTPPK